MDIANYAAILLMDAGAHTHTHTQRHIHTGGRDDAHVDTVGSLQD